MNKFEIGDVVRMKSNQDGHGENLVGEVVCYRYGLVGIRFEERQSWMHNLRSALPDERGWFVFPSLLELEPRIKPYDPTQGNEEDDV